ncbi:MAG: hypothetical protein V4662_27265 [Verrucomicrobiota bacterium]
MFGARNKSFHDIGRSREAADFLSAQLERLMALPLVTPADVECWYQESGKVAQTLERQFPNFLPYQEVVHFFSDADIRARESGYCNSQHKAMSDYVQILRQASEC